MEKLILEILDKGIYYSENDVRVDVPLEKLASEIDALTKEHYFEFVEWIRNNCNSCPKQSVKNGVVEYFNRWFIVKDVDDWDGEPRKVFDDNELYNYWLLNAKNK
jgi:hypothetical protein